MTEPSPSAPEGATRVLIHLSGSVRGAISELSGEEVRIGTGSGMDIVLPGDIQAPPAPHHATLRERGSTYELIAEPGQAVWVNGDAVERLVLASGDVIELGSNGALLRFRSYPAGTRPRPTAVQVFSDCLECAAREADSFGGRARIFLGNLPRDMATRTSRLFRLGMLIAVGALGVSTWALARRSEALEERFTELTRVVGLDELLERADRDDLSPAAISELLAELEEEITSATERLETIEEQVGAAGDVVRNAAAATIFLQGAYGFRDPVTGRMMRLAQGPGGRPIVGPGGTPILTTQGDGPILEITYTGTGFVATPDGLILTNRHIAVPWEFDESARRLTQRGLEPVMRRFVGYLPGETEPFDVSVLASSDEADLAVLRCSVAASVPYLELSERSPEPGDGVVVLGYPLGIRALVARADRGFIEQLRNEGGADFWGVARKLSESGYIAPIATRGIVGQRTAQFVVYDAETTSGGSGGPVLGPDGGVIAVNAAILPEFGGSNLGVPVSHARALIESVKARDPTAPPS